MASLFGIENSSTSGEGNPQQLLQEILVIFSQYMSISIYWLWRLWVKHRGTLGQTLDQMNRFL